MMGGSVFVRARQAVAASLEIGIGGVERASRPALSRMSVREIEAAQDQARDERFAAERRRDEALRRREQLEAEGREWQEKATFALGKQRSDLAEQAIGRQIETEEGAASATADAAAADRDIQRLAATIAQLGEERTRMSAELTQAERRLEREQGTASAIPASAEERAERARARFDRLMEDICSDQPASPTRSDIDGELETLRREDEIARRLAAMRNPKPQPKRRA